MPLLNHHYLDLHVEEFSVSENEEDEEEEATANIFSALNNTVSLLPDAGNISKLYSSRPHQHI